MTLQQIQFCDRLASLGSFNAAARSLGVTQPAISAAVSNLEQELGVTLFLRSRSGIELTQKGIELLPLMRAMTSLSNDITNRTVTLPSDKGRLRVAGRQGFMQFVFPALLARLQQEFPLIEVESVLTGEQTEIVAALRSGRVDLVFGADPGIKSIRAEVIFRDPIYICRPKIQTRKNKESAHHYCLPTSADRLRKPLEKYLRMIDKKAVIAFESDDYTLLGRLVSRGLFSGPVYGHMFLEPSIRASLKRIRTSADEQLYRDLTILYRRDDILPHVESAKRVFSEQTRNLLKSIAPY